MHIVKSLKNLFFLICWPISYLFYTFFKRNLRVLAYHKVNDPAHFEQQLIFLKKRFKLLSIDELFQLISEKRKIPSRSVVLTFDDGDISLKKNALPLLQKHDLPATVFVITELIGTHKPFWWDHIEAYFKKTEGSNQQGRAKVNQLKKESNTVLTAYRSKVEQEFPMEAEQLTLSDLRIFENAKFSIGNHSHTHPMFNRCTQQEISTELTASKLFFDQVGLPGFRYFVYPNGNADEAAEDQLQEFGIRLAFLFDHQLNKQINPLRISRLKVNDYLDLPEFFAKVSGFHSFLMNRRK